MGLEVGTGCRGSAAATAGLSARWTNRPNRRPAAVRPRRTVKTGRCLPIMGTMRRPSRHRLGPALALALACASSAVAVLASRPEDWQHPAGLALLFGLAVAADRFEVISRTGSSLVGSLPIFVLAAFSMFPLLTGLGARAAEPLLAGHGMPWFLLLVAAAYLFAFVVNFALVLGYMRLVRGRDVRLEIRATAVPLIGTQLVLALATAGLAYAYVRLGAGAIAFAGIAILAYSRLQRELMEAERLRDEAQERNAELAAANERLRRSHFGAMRSLVRSIHLHDHMTARHSAAVARYARAIARAAGCSAHDQHLVHTAGLLHDVGKHIFDDAILKGDTKLTDEQWEIVKRHPEEGARIVRLLEGHDEVADIILAHHERMDGRGYPRGLAGEEIPLLARMISIADTYDVMTARDSYRDPVSMADAVAELRRVSGAQLDGELVEIFIREVLGHGDAAFGHGDDADFEAELAFGRLAAGASDAASPSAPVAA